MWQRIIALGLALITVIGCAAPQVISWEQESKAKSYKSKLFEASRTGIAYYQFQSQFFVRATLLSPGFERTLIKERARRARDPQAQTDANLQQALSRSRARIRIFLALSTRDPNWNDLGSKQATLRARIYHGNEGQGSPPLSLQRLTEDEVSDYRPFFPYADALTTGYIVEFEQRKTIGPIRFTISGAPGQVGLEWVLRP